MPAKIYFKFVFHSRPRWVCVIPACTAEEWMAVLKASCRFSAVRSGAVTRVIVRVDGRVTVSSSGQLIIGILQNEGYLELSWWQQKESTQEPLCVSITSHSPDSPQVLYEAPMRAYLLLPTVYFLSAQWLHHTDYNLIFVYVSLLNQALMMCSISKF